MRDRPTMRSFWRDSRGGAAIEFAFVAPALFAIVLGALDVGRMFYVSQGLQYAAEQGARYYTINPSASQTTVTTQIKTYMPGGMGSNVQVTYADTVSCNSNVSVTCTTITAKYSFAFMAAILGIGTKVLKSTSQAVRVSAT